MDGGMRRGRRLGFGVPWRRMETGEEYYPPLRLPPYSYPYSYSYSRFPFEAGE